MQLGWHEHFHEIVVPAWQAYRAAESRLSAAHETKDENTIRRARYDALREGGAAAIYLHHFAEIVSNERVLGALNATEVREVLSAHCFYLRSETAKPEVSLLGDIADALKHAHLTRRVDERAVAARDAVVVLSTGYGKVPVGEGKYGGTEQVIILTKTGVRTLSTILQNVVDAWRRVFELPLPDVGMA